ncbi:hypothetical protein [Methanococcoides burtonii]|uniref:Uncharacterized protein n=1 Tax=Methanococcoides burtonii (strain DSM 6242 / NBRC 107633 / OCM 468 / ACE-M) TaxID=259564 RepID=Q12TY9_METBU|nr:hypothetical protein [Methanococcoides burtonii]ABE53087.1 Hypothetical protein Mbur_2224 [Methanococcoides burtonii DSM 6242]
METSNWPPSNYPIFLALVLLAATAVTLAMGNESRAENLAIYAYYLLVIGVTIRFLEISLPDNTPEKLRSAMARVSGTLRKLYALCSRSAGNIHIFQKLSGLKPSMEHKPISLPRMEQVIKRSHLVLMKSISKDVSINLGVLSVILYVYGSMFGWWIVRGYLEMILLVVIGFSSLYLLSSILLRQSSEN